MAMPMITVMTDEATMDVAARVDGDDGLWLSAAEAEAATGWTLKPEGFCKGPVCMPVPPARALEFAKQGEINVSRLYRHLGAPLAHDDERQTWVLGVSAQARSERLTSLEAPPFELPDLEGNRHSLATHRGKKVLLVSWASW